MNRTAAEVEGEVEATRDRLDHNVEALKQKMTPGQIFDEASRMMGGAGHEIGSKFAEQAKANPMPLAVMGLGLAWLMMSNNKPAAAHAEPRSFAAGEHYGASGADLKQKARDIGARASDAIDDRKQQISGAAGAARERVTDVAGQAQRTIARTFENEPLLLAGLGLIVGAAIGAALPSTEAEDRLMGETRDRLVEKGKDLADSGLQRASSAAQTAYGAVKSEIRTGDAQEGAPH